MADAAEEALRAWRSLQNKLRAEGESARLAPVQKLELDDLARQLFDREAAAERMRQARIFVTKLRPREAC